MLTAQVPERQSPFRQLLTLGSHLGNSARQLFYQRPGSFINEWGESQNFIFIIRWDFKLRCVESPVNVDRIS